MNELNINSLGDRLRDLHALKAKQVNILEELKHSEDDLRIIEQELTKDFDAQKIKLRTEIEEFVAQNSEILTQLRTESQVQMNSIISGTEDENPKIRETSVKAQKSLLLLKESLHKLVRLRRKRLKAKLRTDMIQV